ncbi:MAG: DUF4838 domain-containing protein [Bacteroidales bacterium]|jgi:hypothetical protein|nr:DUF4838 domain-containing protein [Bacteroidales bacterium]
MKKIVLISLCLIFSLSSFAQKDKLTLVKDGKSDYVIVIPHDHSEWIKYSAELLQKDIYKVSNCLIPIVTDKEKPKKKEICISFSDRYDPDMMMLGYGYEVYTEGEKIFIHGDDIFLPDEHYAVVDFLEKHIGIRKFTPDCEVYPTKKDIILDIKDLNYYYSSENNYRQVQSRFTRENKDFRYWLKQHLQEDMFAEGFFVHTFERLVPRAKYFETHPEYFSMINGKRMHDQLCLTNEDVFKIVVERLKEEMKKQPLAMVWSVSQNDNFSYCSCPKCQKINEREEAPSGALIEFVNRVAREFPYKIISTLAYQYSRKAPKTIKPEYNVQIMLCTIEEDRNKTIEESSNDAFKKNPNAQTFAMDIMDWGKITKNIFLWDYNVDFAYSVSPFPNIHVLKPNLLFFMENNAFQHFQQANSDVGHEFAELKTYLISKLLWNINIDQDSIINEFLQGYYGKASSYIRQYIDTLQYFGQNSKVFLDIYAPPTNYSKTFLSKDKIDIYSSIFDKAEEAVGNDSVYLLRVRTARLPLWFAIMEIGKADMFGERGWYMKNGEGKYVLRREMNQMLEDFYSTCVRAKVRDLNESTLSPKEYYESTKRFINISVENNIAFNKKVTSLPNPSPLYSEGNMGTITNGVRGDSEYKIHWLGWNGVDFEIFLDLEHEVRNKNIKLSSLYFPKSWILHPSSVECFVSKDGKTYFGVGKVEVGNIQTKEEIIRDYVFSPKDFDYRYVKFEIKGTNSLPYWHPSEGGTSWVFLDEIIVE